MNAVKIDQVATLNRIRKLSRLMDTSVRIPGIGFRFGLDPVLGLVPGLGDLISTIVSGYILVMALQFKLPAGIIRQMVFNIALESVVGTVPLLGDLFDAFYKSNVRNLRLLEKHLQVAEPDLKATDPLDLSSVEGDTIAQVR